MKGSNVWFIKFMVKDYGKCQGWNGKINRSCNNLAMHIHHIDFNHNNNAKDNLVMLCSSCHRKEHTEWDDDLGGCTQNAFTDMSNAYIGKRLTKGYEMTSDDDKTWAWDDE